MIYASERKSALPPSLVSKIEKMPKAEIHVHIEGATSPDTYYAIAQKHGLKLPVNSLQEFRDFFTFRDFGHFIEVYISSVGLLKFTEDYAFLIEEFYKNQAQQNILYTEAFLSATFITEKFKNDVILDAIAHGMKMGEEKYKVKVNIIPDISREAVDSQTRVTDFVLEGCKRGLFIGLGLGGIENGFPPSLFVESYRKARAAGVHVVAHAGEAAGAESIWGSLKELKAERVGHGVRCLEDATLVAHLRENQIPIEVSPVSNYRLGIVKADEPHPIRKMFDQKLKVTVNSDDPAMFSTSLTNEYLTLAAQGFTWDELWQLNMNTLDATFLTPVEKETYQKTWSAFANLK